MPKLKSILYKVVNTIPVVKTSIMFSVEMGGGNFQNLYETVKNPKQPKHPLSQTPKMSGLHHLTVGHIAA